MIDEGAAMRLKPALTFLFVFMTGAPGFAQLPPSATWAVEAATQYRFAPNVSYTTAGGQEMLLDIYQRRDVDTPQPTLVFLHGGFWVAGAKDNQLPALLPWLEMGWNVVNVEYRLGGEALAPAAFVDCLCALRFVAANADQYNFDTDRIVVSGQSAGGHLALALGIIPESEGFADECPEGVTPPVAAVINWYGVTDVPDVIDGPNRADAAARWFGDMPDPMPLARRLSPLMHVRDDLPPMGTRTTWCPIPRVWLFMRPWPRRTWPTGCLPFPAVDTVVSRRRNASASTWRSGSFSKRTDCRGRSLRPPH
jgi:acetyl esterase/lipase